MKADEFERGMNRARAIMRRDRELLGSLAKGATMQDRLLTAQEVATLVRVHVKTFHRWCRIGLGPPETALGDAVVRFRERDVQKWIEARTQYDLTH